MSKSVEKRLHEEHYIGYTSGASAMKHKISNMIFDMSMKETNLNRALRLQKLASEILNIDAKQFTEAAEKSFRETFKWDWNQDLDDWFEEVG